MNKVLIFNLLSMKYKKFILQNVLSCCMLNLRRFLIKLYMKVLRLLFG